MTYPQYPNTYPTYAPKRTKHGLWYTLTATGALVLGIAFTAPFTGTPAACITSQNDAEALISHTAETLNVIGSTIGTQDVTVMQNLASTLDVRLAETRTLRANLDASQARCN